MPLFSAFVALDTGDYAEVDHLIDAPDPESAARQLLESGILEPLDRFPIILVVEERAVSVFTVDRMRQIVTPDEGVRRRIREERDGRRVHILPGGDPGPS